MGIPPKQHKSIDVFLGKQHNTHPSTYSLTQIHMFVFICVYMCVDIFQDDVNAINRDGLFVDDAYTCEKNVRVRCVLLCCVSDYRGMPELAHCTCHPAYVGACIWCFTEGIRVRDNRTTVYPHVVRFLPMDAVTARKKWHDAMEPDNFIVDEDGNKIDIYKLPPPQ